MKGKVIAILTDPELNTTHKIIELIQKPLDLIGELINVVEMINKLREKFYSH